MPDLNSNKNYSQLFFESQSKLRKANGCTRALIDANVKVCLAIGMPYASAEARWNPVSLPCEGQKKARCEPGFKRIHET